MSMTRRLMGVLLLCGGLWGCASTPTSGEEPPTGRLHMREGRALGNAPACSVDGPACPAGTGCMSLTVDGESQRRCLGGDVCAEWVRCSGGTECVVMESYPAQVRCTGTCTGTDCDTPVSSPAP